jgi:hypothetical protein
VAPQAVSSTASGSSVQAGAARLFSGMAGGLLLCGESSGLLDQGSMEGGFAQRSRIAVADAVAEIPATAKANGAGNQGCAG